MRRLILSLSLLTLSLAASTSTPAQSADSAVENGEWHGNFTGHGVGETVSLKGGVLFYSDEHTPIHSIGDLRGFVIGKGGLYVLNLDGNAQNQLNLAFYDPTQDKWYRGMLNERALLTWQTVGHRSGGYTPLQDRVRVRRFTRWSR